MAVGAICYKHLTKQAQVHDLLWRFFTLEAQFLKKVVQGFWFAYTHGLACLIGMPYVTKRCNFYRFESWKFHSIVLWGFHGRRPLKNKFRLILHNRLLREKSYVMHSNVLRFIQIATVRSWHLTCEGLQHPAENCTVTISIHHQSTRRLGEIFLILSDVLTLTMAT